MQVLCLPVQSLPVNSIFSLIASLLGFTNFIPLCVWQGKVSLCVYSNYNNYLVQDLQHFKILPWMLIEYIPMQITALAFILFLLFWGVGFLFYLARLIQALASYYINLFSGFCTATHPNRLRGGKKKVIS